MALDWEIFDDASEEDVAKILRVARGLGSKPMTEAYKGVGDGPLAGDVLDGGMAEPGGIGLVVPGGTHPHHAVQPQAHGEDQG